MTDRPITTPQTFAWALNSTHTLNVASAPQTLIVRRQLYLWTLERLDRAEPHYHRHSRQQYGDAARDCACGHGLSANFIQLVPYANAIYPTGTGTVTPSPAPLTYSGLSGQYYIIRQLVTLTATPTGGQNFYNYINSPYYLPGGIGANPKTFYVMDDGSSHQSDYLLHQLSGVHGDYESGGIECWCAR